MVTYKAPKVGQSRLNNSFENICGFTYSTCEKTKQSLKEATSPVPKLQVRQWKIKLLIYMMCQVEQAGNHLKKQKHDELRQTGFGQHPLPLC